MLFLAAAVIVFLRALLDVMMTFFPFAAVGTVVEPLRIVLVLLLPRPILVTVGRAGKGKIYFPILVGDWRDNAGDILVGDSIEALHPGESIISAVAKRWGDVFLTAGCFRFIGDWSFLRRPVNLVAVEDEAAAMMDSIFVCNSSLSVRLITWILPSSRSVGAVDCEEVMSVDCDEAADVIEDTAEDVRTMFLVVTVETGGAIGTAVCVSNSTYAPECSPERRLLRSPNAAASRSNISSSVSSLNGRRPSAVLFKLDEEIGALEDGFETFADQRWVLLAP